MHLGWPKAKVTMPPYLLLCSLTVQGPGSISGVGTATWESVDQQAARMGTRAWQWLIYWDTRAAEEGLGIFPWHLRLPQIWLQLTFLALSPSMRDPSTHTTHWPATAYGALESPSQPAHLSSHRPLSSAPAPLFPASVVSPSTNLTSSVKWFSYLAFSIFVAFHKISFYVHYVFSL